MQRIACTKFASAKFTGAKFLRAVAHRLPMCANGHNAVAVRCGCSQQIGHNVCIRANQRIGCQRGTVQLVATAGIEQQKFIRQRWSEPVVAVLQNGGSGA